MNYVPPQQPPPFNDALYRALAPMAQQSQQDNVKLRQILQKYGKPSSPQQAPKPPSIQWMGDNHA